VRGVGCIILWIMEYIIVILLFIKIKIIIIVAVDSITTVFTTAVVVVMRISGLAFIIKCTAFV
jgi:hypothetical protein